MLLKLSILCENSVKTFCPAIAEHGFSCYVETDRGNYLFDTGQGLAIKHNSLVLKKNLSELKAIISSHGHCDHIGGLAEALKFSGPKPIYAHPDIFTKHCKVLDGKQIYCGILANKNYLEGLGASFIFNKEMIEIQPGMYLTGEVPKTNNFENGDKNLMTFDDDGKLIHDPIKDDNTLVFDTKKGLIILFGCAHTGMVNIIDYVAKKLNKNKIYAILGGTHLSPASDEQLTKSIEAIERYQIQHIGVSHCTGLKKAAILSEKFKDKFFFANVGSEFVVSNLDGPRKAFD
jgi:7,8-dihydropterin-6-yl-methyl-4-(beta-D-ribofuranosyl)aminobenzene 5'-phosphate synthase